MGRYLRLFTFWSRAELESLEQSHIAAPHERAAQRALAEAQARRAATDANAQAAAKESGGPKGPEPTRYGDWENKGIAADV